METETRANEPLSRVVELGTRRASPDGVHRYPAVISTTTAVGRRTPSGRAYDEVLSHTPGAIDLSRAPLPLLEGHDASRVNVGIVTDLHLDGDKLRGIVVLGTSARAVELARDIDAKIVSGLSVGYLIEAAQWSDDGATQTATRWVPYETSLTGVPADIHAGIGRSQSHASPRSSTMTTPVVPSTTSPDALAERERISGIQAACRAVRMPDRADRLIADGTPLDAARAQLLAAAADAQPEISSHPSIERGEDASDKWSRGAVSAMLHRSGKLALVSEAKKKGTPDLEDVDTSGGGELRGYSVAELARTTLERRGVRTGGMSRSRVIGTALTTRGGGMNSTSDFPILLENAMHKILLAAYALAPSSWSKVCKVETVSDFRTHSRYRGGSFGTLERVPEGGTFPQRGIPDGERLQISTDTKGGLIAISRQALVNDDLGSFADLAERLGRAAQLSIEEDFYALLNANSGLGPTMADTNPFFFSGRGNINGTGSALSIAGLDADRQVMAAQKDVSGNHYLDLRPSVLLVPMALGSSARIINAAEYFIDAPDPRVQVPNAVKGLFGEIVDTPRITGTRRYLFCSPAIAPAFVVAFLEGNGPAPYLESKEGWEVDGTELKVRLDYLVQPFDPRGAVSNAGQ